MNFCPFEAGAFLIYIADATSYIIREVTGIPGEAPPPFGNEEHTHAGLLAVQSTKVRLPTGLTFQFGLPFRQDGFVGSQLPEDCVPPDAPRTRGDHV